MDRTDPTARNQGQQRAQGENERRTKELFDEMERDRRQALCNLCKKGNWLVRDVRGRKKKKT